MFQTNQYFDGKVASIGFEEEKGKATVGVMAPGIYEFGTSTIEIMTVISGEMTVKLPGESDWKVFKQLDSFKVAKDVTFEVKVSVDTPYHCLYL